MTRVGHTYIVETNRHTSTFIIAFIRTLIPKSNTHIFFTYRIHAQSRTSRYVSLCSR